MIINSRKKWPFPAITKARATDNAWVEISQKHADELMNAVPPIYFPGGFMVSEAAAHDEDGTPIYCAVVKVKGHYLARELRVDKRHLAYVNAYEAYSAAVA